MANINVAYSISKTLTTSGLSNLASNSSATSNTFDATSTNPLEVLVELAVTTGTVSGNTRALVFAITSVDGTNFSDTTVEANMVLLGVLSTPSSSTAYRSKEFSVASAFGGFVPNHFKVVVKNDGGGTYGAGVLTYRELTATVV